MPVAMAVENVEVVGINVVCEKCSVSEGKGENLRCMTHGSLCADSSRGSKSCGSGGSDRADNANVKLIANVGKGMLSLKGRR